MAGMFSIIPIDMHGRPVMNFFIRMKDGLPFEHPISKSNLRKSFPALDTNDLPNWIAVFEKTEKPEIGVYEVYSETTYEVVKDVVKEVHKIEKMSPDEKLNKQNKIKELYKDCLNKNYVFDEQKCAIVPKLSIGVTYV